jgi:DNA-binding XRE family transcriptional regulator
MDKFIRPLQNNYLSQVEAVAQVLKQCNALKDILVDSQKQGNTQNYFQENEYMNPNIVNLISEETDRMNNLILNQLEVKKGRKIVDAYLSTTLSVYLQENGISQTWLSERTGINRVTLANLIAKPSSVSLINAYKISMAVNKPIESLFPIFVKYEDAE